VKFLYYDLGLKHIFIVLIMVAYALLGGLMFYYLEVETDQTNREDVRKVSVGFNFIQL
jgi:hypothetical protein